MFFLDLNVYHGEIMVSVVVLDFKPEVFAPRERVDLVVSLAVEKVAADGDPHPTKWGSSG